MDQYQTTSYRRWAIRSLGIAVAYAVTGKISILLAIPPGYATAIWPASGIALAAVVILGYRVWPGVLLGSFLVNVWISLDASTVATIVGSLVIPIGIGAGAALQAVIGAYCVRRFAGFPNSLGNEREVFSFLFWGGPASCLVNSIIGSSILLAAGIIPAPNFLINFGTWWIGDTIGVFIFAPLVLVWLMHPRAVWQPRRLTVTLPIAVTFAVTVIVVAFGANWERQRLKLQFNQQAATFAPSLERTLSKYIGVLYFLEGFHSASPNFDREDFRTFVNQSLAELAGLKALSWNPRILGSERAAFEDRHRRQGFPNFQIAERDAGGGLVRAAERPEYVAVEYIEPFKGNESAFGFDVASDPKRRVSLERARDTGRPISTGRITLVQETGWQFGVLVFMPAYRRGLPHDTLEMRRSNLAGYMVGVLRAGDIVHAALQGLDQEGLVYRLFDASAPPEAQLLFESHPHGTGIFTLDEKGLFGGTTSIGRSFPFQFGDRQWRFEISPSQRYLARHRQENAWLILIAGMLLTSLVGAFVMVMSGRRESLRRLVEERTVNLQLSENRLAQAQRIALLGNWEWNIATNELWWSDEAYRIFGVEPGKSKVSFERFLEYTHPDDHDFVEKTIANALEEKKPFSIDHTIVLTDGTEKFVHTNGEVTFGADGQPSRLIGTIQDITDRKKLDRMKGEFVSTVSHELRTPLTSIKGSLGLVAGGILGTLPEKAQDMIGVAYQNTERLITLVNDILDLEKLESGKMEFDLRLLDLSGLTREATEANKGYASEYGVNFIFTDFASDVTVRGDGDRLTQVIANLLSNAAKFSPEGGDVEISVTRHDQTARVSVRDHGVGIPEGFNDHIFGRFTQGDSSDTRHKGGTGLGLNISKTIIDRHGGSIDFVIEPSGGTLFYFELPIAG